MSNELPLIRVLTPTLPTADKIVDYLSSIDISHRYSNFGPLVTELENRIASYFNVRPEFVVSVDNATNGIIGSLATNLISPGVWRLPSWTFIATPQAALHAGIDFQFCDIDSNLRPDFPIESTHLIDVLPFGQNGRSYENYPALKTIVIDAAASLQNLSNFKFPDIPTALVVSLHATKMFGSGEGGIVIFNDTSWADKFRRWTSFGMGQNRIPTQIGINGKMSEYTGAIALASLDQMQETVSAWKVINQKAQALSIKHGIKALSPLGPDLPSVYWNIEVSTMGEIEKWESHFKSHGIETRRWWPVATHTIQIFSRGVDGKSEFKNSIYRADSTLGLPLHLGLSENDFERISKCISSI